METGIPRKRPWRPLVVLTLLALVGIGYLIAAYQREPELLDRAVRITRTNNWIQTYGGYYWQSDRAILAFRPFDSGLTALNVQADTGQETPLMGLTARWNRPLASETSGWRL